MSNSPKNSSLTRVLGIAAVGMAVILYGFYMYSQKKKFDGQPCKVAEKVVTAPGQESKQDQKKVYIHFNAEQRQEIQEVLFETLREKPDLFMNAMNEGMQAQQDKLRQEMEKTATGMREKLLSAGIVMGPTQGAAVQLIAFIDPMCPHCHDFERLANALLQQRQDVAIHMIMVPILGPNSVAMSKVMLAAAKQSVDKMRTFVLKFVEKIDEVDRNKLLQLAKESGLDVAKLEKDEVSEEVDKTLAANAQLAEELKIPGVPTIFGVNKDGQLSVIPPMDIDGFKKMIDSLKEGPDAGKEEKTEKVESKDTAVEPKAEQPAPKVEEEVKKEEAPASQPKEAVKKDDKQS